MIYAQSVRVLGYVYMAFSKSRQRGKDIYFSIR